MKHFFVLTACIALLIVPAAPVVAQENQTVSPTDLPEGFELEEDVCAQPEPIDQNINLCSAELHGSTAVVVLEADQYQQVTLTDGAGLLSRGPINRDTRDVPAGEPVTLTLDVTRRQGFAGVTIDTGDVLFGVPLDESSTLIGGPWGPQDTQLAALTAGLSTALLSGLVVLRTIYGRTDEPERVA